MAERRGNGLQIRVHGFKSRTHLGRLAQLVARFPDTEEVISSNLVPPTSITPSQTGFLSSRTTPGDEGHVPLGVPVGRTPPHYGRSRTLTDSPDRDGPAGNSSQSAAPQSDMHAKRRAKRTDPELDVLIGDAVRRAQEASQTLNAFAELVEQIGTLASDPRQPLLLTINEAAEVLGVGRSTVYDMVARDELPAVTLGKSMRIRRADIERYVETLPKAKRQAAS